MAEENIDGAVKWLMKRLMETSAESFELAFARYETSEREAALGQARRLMESGDPDERELGERLKAEVMKEQRKTASLMLEAPGGNGVAHDPLLLSPSPSSPVAASPSPEPETEGAAKRPGRPPRLKQEPSPPDAVIPAREAWSWQTSKELAAGIGHLVSVVVRVEGAEAASVTTAIAIEGVRGRPFRAIVGAQVGRIKPRESLNTTVIDTSQGQGG